MTKLIQSSAHESISNNVNAEFTTDVALAILCFFINPKGVRAALGDSVVVDDKFRKFVLDKWNSAVVAYQIKIAA